MQCITGLVLDVREALSAVFVGSVVWDAKAIAGPCGGVYYLSVTHGTVGVMGQVWKIRRIGMPPPLSQDA